MSGKRLIVQKYGGATLADPQKIKAVARRLANLHKDNTQVVAVVSAMGKTTNQLIELAAQVSQRPNRRELDMLLTTGERVSMALVTMALHDLGCPAISFTGSQAGILTNESHFNAYITDVKAIRVDEALQQGKAVVLAGFQGVSPKTKEITTLGRGGSDSTAVAMAAYLKADRCEILKDVPAVFTADPNLVKSAKPLHELSYDQLYEMTFWGAKVLYYRSVELAREKEVPLYIGLASEKRDSGTLVGKTLNQTATPKALALNSHERVFTLQGKYGDITQAAKALEDLLNKVEIAFPQVLHAEKTEAGVSFLITGPKEILLAIDKELKTNPDFDFNKEELCTVSLTYSIPPLESERGKLDEILRKEKIQVERNIISSLSFNYVLKSADREKVVQLLHSQIS